MKDPMKDPVLRYTFGCIIAAFRLYMGIAANDMRSIIARRREQLRHARESYSLVNDVAASGEQFFRELFGEDEPIPRGPLMCSCEHCRAGLAAELEALAKNDPAWAEMEWAKKWAEHGPDMSGTPETGKGWIPPNDGETFPDYCKRVGGVPWTAPDAIDGGPLDERSFWNAKGGAWTSDSDGGPPRDGETFAHYCARKRNAGLTPPSGFGPDMAKDVWSELAMAWTRPRPTPPLGGLDVGVYAVDIKPADAQRLSDMTGGVIPKA